MVGDGFVLASLSRGSRDPPHGLLQMKCMRLADISEQHQEAHDINSASSGFPGSYGLILHACPYAGKVADLMTVEPSNEQSEWKYGIFMSRTYILSRPQSGSVGARARALRRALGRPRQSTDRDATSHAR